MKSSRIFKPWLILPPKVLAALLMLLALAALAVGVYTGFFATKGFKSTTATIERIEEDETFVSADPNDKHYIAYVTYTADGTVYTEALDSYSPSYEVGKEIKVKYDPADPATVRSASLGFSLYLILIGAALIAVSVFTMVKNGQQRSEVKADKAVGGAPQPLFSTSSPTWARPRAPAIWRTPIETSSTRRCATSSPWWGTPSTPSRTGSTAPRSSIPWARP